MKIFLYKLFRNMVSLSNNSFDHISIFKIQKLHPFLYLKMKDLRKKGNNILVAVLRCKEYNKMYQNVHQKKDEINSINFLIYSYTFFFHSKPFKTDT